MPKLDLSRARRIKSASGELAALKGPGFAWAKPVVAGGAAWTPLTDATLAAKIAAWLDFSDTSTHTASAGTVTHVTDKAHGRVFAASGTTPVLGSIDGKPSWPMLQGSLLTSVATIAYPAGGAFVGISFGDDEPIDFKDYMAVGHAGRTLHINPRMARIWGYGNVAWDTLGANAQANVFSIDVPVGGAGDTSLVFQDGTQHAPSGEQQNGTRSYTSLTDAPVNMLVGQASLGSLTSQMGECLFIAGNLTTAERQKLEGYLAHKWGTEAKLPAGHPYKAAPPAS